VPCLFVLAILGIATAPSARADEIFNLTLTANSPQPPAFGGTGTLTLNNLPSTVTQTTYTIGGVNALTLSFTIDGVTFNETSGCTAQYSTTGVLNSLFGCSAVTSSGDTLQSLNMSGTSGSYQASFPGDSINGGSVSGNIAIGQGVIVSPEPSACLMLGSGLLGLIGMAYRRKKLA
jgi:hypothetical protein